MVVILCLLSYHRVGVKAVLEGEDELLKVA